MAAVLTFEVVRYFYLKPKFKEGENITSFSASMLNGEKFELDQLKGKYILLDFYKNTDTLICSVLKNID